MQVSLRIWLKSDFLTSPIILSSSLSKHTHTHTHTHSHTHTRTHTHTHAQSHQEFLCEERKPEGIIYFVWRTVLWAMHTVIIFTYSDCMYCTHGLNRKHEVHPQLRKLNPRTMASNAPVGSLASGRAGIEPSSYLTSWHDWHWIMGNI